MYNFYIHTYIVTFLSYFISYIQKLSSVHGESSTLEGKLEANTNAAFHLNTKAKSIQIVTDSLNFLVHFSTFIVCDWVELGGGGAPSPPTP